MLTSVDTEPVISDPITENVGDKSLPLHAPRKSWKTNHGDVSGTAVCKSKPNTEPQCKPSDNVQFDEKLKLDCKCLLSTLIDKHTHVFAANTKDMVNVDCSPEIAGKCSGTVMAAYPPSRAAIHTAFERG